MVNIDLYFAYSSAIPIRATEGSSGFDLTAYHIKEEELPYTLKPMEIVLVDTGIAMAIPKGYEGQVRPRSGLALKHGITIINAPGTIDSDYRGNIGVPLINLSDKDFVIEPNMKIAQIVFAAVPEVKFTFVPEKTKLGKTSRKGGFGHTGL